jgi:hypothetical protein
MDNNEPSPLRSRYLATLTLDPGAAHDLGVTPSGWRRMRSLPSGSLRGPRIDARYSRSHSPTGLG